MVKEIIKNARDPVKNRIIPQPILEKYSKKVAALAPQVLTVVQEEQAEREIASLENQANKLENKLKEEGRDGEPGMKPERKFELKSKMEEKKKKLSHKKKRMPDFEDEDQKKLFFEGKAMQRSIKNQKKLKKIRTVKEDSERRGGKKRKNSSVEANIFDVKKSNVKRMRHEGSSAQRMNGKKKGAGKR